MGDTATSDQMIRLSTETIGEIRSNSIRCRTGWIITIRGNVDARGAETNFPTRPSQLPVVSMQVGYHAPPPHTTLY